MWLARVGENPFADEPSAHVRELQRSSNANVEGRSPFDLV